jgi:hypothetical protein
MPMISDEMQVDKEHFEQYAKRYTELGYSGFVLWWREDHQEDPSAELLKQLAEHYERRTRSLGARLAQGVIEALT